MSRQKLKQVTIQPQDFSNRKFFPGTLDNPFHKINRIHNFLSRLPAPFYALLLGGVFYLVSGQYSKALIYTGFILLDWLLLRLLPAFQVSFGPTHLSLVLLAVMRLPFLLFNLPITILVQGLGTLLVIYSFYLEPQYPKVNEYTLSLSAASLKCRKVRIVHLSDLHMAFITKREKRVIKKVNALSPDLILFTGDFFNLSYQEHPKTLQDVVYFFNQLDAKYGIFGVTGSPSVDVVHSIDKIRPDLNLNLLDDGTFIVNINGVKIHLIGLTCTHKPNQDADKLEELIADIKADAEILLYHSPDIAPRLSLFPIDLQLSGHTHGGQVQLPWVGPIYAGSLYGLKFSSGFYQVNRSLFLIISRGLGLEGEAAPRVRFLSPPEIGLISLEFDQDTVKL